MQYKFLQNNSTKVSKDIHPDKHVSKFDSVKQRIFIVDPKTVETIDRSYRKILPLQGLIQSFKFLNFSLRTSVNK